MSAVLFYTVGLPGAGKTSFANNLSHWLGIPHLRGDKIGLELFRFPTFSPQERQMVYGEMGRRAQAALGAGKHVIYDAAVNSRSERLRLVHLAHESGGQAIGVLIDVPTELAKKRAGALRDAGLASPVARIIPPHIFDQYVAAFEPPSDNEDIITISGEAYFALQYRRLQRQLPNLVLPRLI